MIPRATGVFARVLHKVGAIAWAVLLSAPFAVAGAVIHVDSRAAAGGDGASWARAFDHLQEALAVVGPGDEVRVAVGTYRPAPPGGDRSLSFDLRAGIALRGGYAGIGAPDPDARDSTEHPTILSGDLNGDDVELDMTIDFNGAGPTRAENSEHVVTCASAVAGSGTILDGFVVTAGNANFPNGGLGDYGGGMYNSSASPLVVDCVFRANTAESGGAMGNQQSSPVLRNCTFAGNMAYGTGVMFNNGGAPLIEDCIFEDNVGEDQVGVMDSRGDLTVRRCIFRRNSSLEFAGVAENSGGTIVFVACSFIENSSDDGAVFWNEAGRITIDGCRFIGNQANLGGCILNGYLDLPVVDIRNCLFVRNTGGQGAGIRDLESKTVVANCVFADNEGPGIYVTESGNTTALNCIFWNNVAGSETGEEAQIWQYPDDPGTLLVNHCCVQGWTGALGGTGNFGADPLFLDEAAGDYHLLPGSPCIDAGAAEGAPATDMEGRTRPCGAGVDIGAYEFGNCRPTQPLVRGDANADGTPDMSDAVKILGFLFLGTTLNDCMDAADVNDDGKVDISDPVRLLGHLFLGSECPPEPFSSCGIDPTVDDLDCNAFSDCP